MTQIKDLQQCKGQDVELKGWVQNKRTSRGLVFIVLRDGSGFCQVIVDENVVDENNFNNGKSLTVESAVNIKGKVVEDEKQEGGIEIHTAELSIYHLAEEYPLSNKAHGPDFLMNNRHLWLRSRRQWAIMRVRNAAIYAIHNFFQKRDFVQMDAPILTGNACEGTTDLFETNYFDRPAYLSQSGQLYGEAMAMAQGKIYTFGPTFRAEKSKTRRHLTEFWMIEPEMAFYDNEMNMDLIQDFLKEVVNEIVDKCPTELATIDRDVSKLKVVDEEFSRISYSEAVKVLRGEVEINGKNSLKVLENDLQEAKDLIATIQSEIQERELIVNDNNQKKGIRNFNRNKVDNLKNDIKDQEELIRNIPQWMESAANFEHGNDLGGSDETILTRMYDGITMVYNWPHEVKAFYMKRDENDDRFAKGVDVLAPEGYGEIIGGAERETSSSKLLAAIEEHNLPKEEFDWYLDLRKYGSVPHAGFGLGLERLVSWVCKLDHIRETIPFARMTGRLNP